MAALVYTRSSAAEGIHTTRQVIAFIGMIFCKYTAFFIEYNMSALALYCNTFICLRI